MLREYRGKVRLIMKDFPLPSHELARPAHEAARCAGALGKFWPYHDRLFAMQPHFERERLIQYAVDVGLDRRAFTRCIDDHRYGPAVEADVSQGRAIGVKATPTFIINGRGILEGAYPVETFRAVIDDALKAQTR